MIIITMYEVGEEKCVIEYNKSNENTYKLLLNVSASSMENCYSMLWCAVFTNTYLRVVYLYGYRAEIVRIERENYTVNKGNKIEEVTKEKEKKKLKFIG